MKPSEHPEFFRLPPPEGRSRESTIVLDAEGRFHHEGAPVTHPGMQRAFSSWIARHPRDGRYILNNGYDWSYFTVADAPFFVVAVRASSLETLELELSDGTREALDPATLRLGAAGELYAMVKEGAYAAKFSRSAQLSLAPYLSEGEQGETLFVLGDARVELRQATIHRAESAEPERPRQR